MSEYRIQMNKYKNLVIRKADGEEVYNDIMNHILNGDSIIVDFRGIDTMTTYFAKQVFGRIYLELGAEKFSSLVNFERKNMSEDVELVLKIGIAGAISQQ